MSMAIPDKRPGISMSRHFADVPCDIIDRNHRRLSVTSNWRQLIHPTTDVLRLQDRSSAA
jgi:hypothetical protein